MKEKLWSMKTIAPVRRHHIFLIAVAGVAEEGEAFVMDLNMAQGWSYLYVAGVFVRSSRSPSL